MIRLAKKEDLKDVRQLWGYCFKDGQDYIDYYFQNIYASENNIVLEEKGKIEASLMLNPYRIMINKKWFNTSYVVGVSTSPSARGRGLMRGIMNESFDEMKRRNNDVAILMPIDHRLYRPYGYEDISDMKMYEMDIENLKGYRFSGEFVKISKDNINDASKIYEECLSDSNVYVNRDTSYCENQVKEIDVEGGHAYFYEEDGVKMGYIIYFFMEDHIFVREMFYTDVSALEAFLSFIYNHNTQFKKVKIMEPLNKHLKDAIRNFNGVEISVKPFMMGRIIDFKGFVEKLDFESGKDGEFTIDIQDENMESNNKTFRVEIKDNRAIVWEVSMQADMRMDIKAALQWLFSYRSIDELTFMKKAEIKDTSKLSFMRSLIRKKDNYINEYV